MRNFFLNQKKQIPHSEITIWDEKALRELLHQKHNLKILEVGSWLGMGSTQVLAEFASELVCVDNWQGNNTLAHNLALKKFSPLEVFLENTKSISTKLVTVIADSAHAATLLQDNYFDFIFIDADHRYVGVKNDIQLFLPKLKAGGIISGHDCEGRISNPKFVFSTNELEIDVIPSPISKFIHVHSGVISAVGDVFGENVFLYSDDANAFKDENGGNCYSSIWAHGKQ